LEAESHLKKGRSVVLDAGYRSRTRRAPVTRLADELDVPRCWLHLSVDEQTVRQRLRRRAEEEHSVSDADEQVYQKLKAAWEPLDELPSEQVCRLSGTESDTAVMKRVIEALIRSKPMEKPSTLFSG
ncbi:MAG: AAA family ATPase, partial [Phycisphaeraceae bacterium]|nr:AAA family ATPase [Phycisphaeraceae bacterium]